MQYPKKIMDNHKRLSIYSEKFLEFAHKNTWAMDRSHAQQILHSNIEYVKLNLWPTFVRTEIREEAEAAAQAVFKLFRKIIPGYFNNDAEKMSQYYGLPKDIVSMFMRGVTQFHLDHLLGRGDFVYSPGRGWKCMEYNITGNLGGENIGNWERQYMQTRHVSTFMQENDVKSLNQDVYVLAFENFIDAMVEKFPNIQDQMNHAMILPGHHGNPAQLNAIEIMGNKLYQSILKKRNPRFKGELIVCDFRHVKVLGGFMYYNGKRILSFQEHHTGFLPENVMASFEAGKVLVYNGGVGKFMSHKLNLAILSENAHMDIFTDQDREDIDKYVPWSRKSEHKETTYDGQKVNLYDFCLENREKLVLKPGNDYGGIGIAIGRDVSDDEWQKALDRAFDEKSWILQEFYQPESYMYPYGSDSSQGLTECSMVWGVFVFGNRYGGSFLRIAPSSNDSSVVNSTQGAEITVMLETNK